jgi:hypothetical protein
MSSTTADALVDLDDRPSDVVQAGIGVTEDVEFRHAARMRICTVGSGRQMPDAERPGV